MGLLRSLIAATDTPFTHGSRPPMTHLSDIVVRQAQDLSWQLGTCSDQNELEASALQWLRTRPLQSRFLHRLPRLQCSDTSEDRALRRRLRRGRNQRL